MSSWVEREGTDTAGTEAVLCSAVKADQFNFKPRDFKREEFFYAATTRIPLYPTCHHHPGREGYRPVNKCMGLWTGFWAD